jgi:hypothetical protein
MTERSVDVKKKTCHLVFHAILDEICDLDNEMVGFTTFAWSRSRPTAPCAYARSASTTSAPPSPARRRLRSAPLAPVDAA